jgi:hypothetical protein
VTHIQLQHMKVVRIHITEQAIESAYRTWR